MHLLPLFLFFLTSFSSGTSSSSLQFSYGVASLSADSRRCHLLFPCASGSSTLRRVAPLAYARALGRTCLVRLRLARALDLAPGSHSSAPAAPPLARTAPLRLAPSSATSLQCALLPSSSPCPMLGPRSRSPRPTGVPAARPSAAASAPLPLGCCSTLPGPWLLGRCLWFEIRRWCCRGILLYSPPLAL